MAKNNALIRVVISSAYGKQKVLKDFTMRGRVTPTQIKVDGTTYDRKTGRRVPHFSLSAYRHSVTIIEQDEE